MTPHKIIVTKQIDKMPCILMYGVHMWLAAQPGTGAAMGLEHEGKAGKAMAFGAGAP